MAVSANEASAGDDDGGLGVVVDMQVSSLRFYVFPAAFRQAIAGRKKKAAARAWRRPY
jgi:hypothetical protein